MGPKKGVSAVAAARLQGWALLLSAHTNELEFRATTLHSNADALSVTLAREYYLQQLDCLPVTSQEIRKANEQDPMRSEVHLYLLRGWPAQVDANLRSHHSKLAELSVEAGCLMWGGREIIPKALTMKVLEELDREHMGVAKMKASMCGGEVSLTTWKHWQSLVPNVLPLSNHQPLH